MFSERSTIGIGWAGILDMKADVPHSCPLRHQGMFTTSISKAQRRMDTPHLRFVTNYAAARSIRAGLWKIRVVSWKNVREDKKVATVARRTGVQGGRGRVQRWRTYLQRHPQVVATDRDSASRGGGETSHASGLSESSRRSIERRAPNDLSSRWKNPGSQTTIQETKTPKLAMDKMHVERCANANALESWGLPSYRIETFSLLDLESLGGPRQEIEQEPDKTSVRLCGYSDKAHIAGLTERRDCTWQVQEFTQLNTRKEFEGYHRKRRRSHMDLPKNKCGGKTASASSARTMTS
ncbi:hypothetical protein C8J57DRAFT_1231362 [Mycena rebaudengoi]|nr:hypothetical protein C8J57DRAFT_1231362 [Mycena rebaudengoi]